MSTPATIILSLSAILAVIAMATAASLGGDNLSGFGHGDPIHSGNFQQWKKSVPFGQGNLMRSNEFQQWKKRMMLNPSNDGFQKFGSENQLRFMDWENGFKRDGNKRAFGNNFASNFGSSNHESNTGTLQDWSNGYQKKSA